MLETLEQELLQVIKEIQEIQVLVQILETQE